MPRRGFARRRRRARPPDPRRSHHAAALADVSAADQTIPATSQPDFDERRYGSMADLMRACQKDGMLRLERDRQGGLRVFANGARTSRGSVPHGWGLVVAVARPAKQWIRGADRAAAVETAPRAPRARSIAADRRRPERASRDAEAEPQPKKKASTRSASDRAPKRKRTRGASRKRPGSRAPMPSLGTQRSIRPPYNYSRGSLIHRKRHHRPRRARARPQAPRHVHRRRRQHRPAPPRLGDPRQLDRRGDERPRLEHPRHAAQGRLVDHHRRRRPRHSGGRAPEDEEERARSDLHRAPCRRQVRGRQLQDRRRPSRRRRERRQRAVARTGRHGQARRLSSGR